MLAEMHTGGIYLERSTWKPATAVTYMSALNTDEQTCIQCTHTHTQAECCYIRPCAPQHSVAYN